LILLLLSQAGLRRDEAVSLEVINVGEKALRVRGKEDKDRTVPMTQALLAAIKPFCEGKKPHDSVLGFKEKAIYMAVKKYAKLAGKPDIKPHDLRHAFATRLLENGVNIRIIQELLGHADLATTQIYASVSGVHMEDAIKTLDFSIEGPKKDLYTDEKTTLKPLASEKAMEFSEDANTDRETPRKQKMRELAKTLAERINLPSLWDRALWRDLPIDFQPGKYYLPIGAVEIDKDKRIEVNYYDVSADFAQPHHIKGLFSHLSSSGLPKFTELVGDRGKFKNLVVETGQYSEALLEFLRIIEEDIKGYGTKLNFDDEMLPGLTRWFIITVWKDAIDIASISFH
jgi:hypothetical protein